MKTEDKTLIEVKNLTKVYGDHAAVDGLRVAEAILSAFAPLE